VGRAIPHVGGGKSHTEVENTHTQVVEKATQRWRLDSLWEKCLFWTNS